MLLTEITYPPAVLMTTYTVLFMMCYFVDIEIQFFPALGLMVYSNSMLVLLNNRGIIVNGANVLESFEFIEVSAR
jgi:hypothetical protein